MEVDEHLLWLISAVKAATDAGVVNKEKLVKNVSSCFLRIKKEKRALSAAAAAAGQPAEELQDFQVKASVLLLLCLPSIRQLPNIKHCAELQSLTSSLPELSISVFFTMVRTQKIYFLLSPLLSWLPAQAVHTLAREYFHGTAEVTPMTLAIAVELLRAMLFASQRCQTSHENSLHNKENLGLLVKFLSLKDVSDASPAVIKFSGYLCMYMFECLYLLLSAYVGRMWTPPTYSCAKVWTELWEKGECNKEASIAYMTEATKSVLMLCQKNNSDVTVQMWMEWSEQMLPQTTQVHTGSRQLGKGRSKSIQLVICNVAFDVLKVLEAHPQLRDDLDTSACQELMQFFQQVAADPDHDPDQDLNLEQLLEEINLKDERRGKLLGFLVQNDGVFSNEGACSCLREHAAALDSQMRLDLLQRCIEWTKADKDANSEFRNVVLDLAADLSPEQLMSFIECNLSSGLDDTLKTPSFRNQLTAVLNQLADEGSAQASGRHVWLCLQSGRGVVEEAVQLAVTMTGLVPVMVKALADIPQVCRAVLPSGNTLLATTLVTWQNSALTEQEEQEFISLVKHLLSEEGVLGSEEVMKLMVEPSLMVEGSRNLEKLIMPLEILKEVVSQDVGTVVVSGPAVVSLSLALTHVVDATMCLEGQGASVLLTLRSLASTILVQLTDAIVSSDNKYEKELCLVKQCVGQYKLHPLSVVCLSRVLGAEFSGDRRPDLVLQALLKVSSSLQPEGSQHIPAAVFTSLQAMSRTEWIYSLLQVLPHASESEWRAAFFLADCAFGSQPNVFAVLEVFQAAVYLVCECLAATHIPLHPQEPDMPPPQPPPPASLHHCFLFFSSAAMSYFEVKAQTLSPRERFLNLVDIFRWWCCTVPSFCCNPELPTLFLARLCGALEELLVSGRLKVVSGEHTQPGSESKTTRLYEDKEKPKEKAREENQKHTKPGSEGNALRVCVSEGESRSAPQYNVDEVSVHTGEDADKENHDLKEKLTAINEGESDVLSVESKSENRARTGEETERKTSSQVELTAHNEAGGCAPSEKEADAHKASVQAREESENHRQISQEESEEVYAWFQPRKGGSGVLSSISEDILTEELEQMTLYMAKYVPSSNLLASVAGKLKKMYDA